MIFSFVRVSYFCRGTYIMSRTRRLFPVLFIFSLILLFLPAGASAEGTTSLAVSSSQPSVGDSLTVTVSGSDSSALTLKYTSSVLTFQSCSASGYSTSGNSVVFRGSSATVKFSVASAGKANLILTSDSLSGTSASITAADSADSQTTDDSAAQDTADAQAQTADPDFTVDGTDYVISERYSDSEIPAGFEKQAVTVHDSTYREPVRDGMTLLYLKPASDTSSSGTFFIYQADDDSVSPMTLVGTTEDYVILLTPPSLPTDALTQTETAMFDQQVSCYQISGLTSDFYYLYGMDEIGTTDWFVYDAADGSLGHADTSLLASYDTGAQTSATSSDDQGSFFSLTKQQFHRLIAVVIFVAAVVFVILLNGIFFHNRKNEPEDDESEDEDSDDVFPTRQEVAEKLAANEKAAKENEARKITSEEKADEKQTDEEDADDGQVKEMKKYHLFHRKNHEDNQDERPNDDDELLKTELSRDEAFERDASLFEDPDDEFAIREDEEKPEKHGLFSRHKNDDDIWAERPKDEDAAGVRSSRPKKTDVHQDDDGAAEGAADTETEHGGTSKDASSHDLDVLDLNDL